MLVVSDTKQLFFVVRIELFNRVGPFAEVESMLMPPRIAVSLPVNRLELFEGFSSIALSM